MHRWIASGPQKNALADATMNFAPAVVAGIVLAAVVAATMSSASGNMIGTATMFTNDVFRPYINGGKQDDAKEIWISRVVMVIVGGVGLIVALTASNIISVMMGAFALRSAGPFAAFICGLFYKNVTQMSRIYLYCIRNHRSSNLDLWTAYTMGIKCNGSRRYRSFNCHLCGIGNERSMGVAPAPELELEED